MDVVDVVCVGGEQIPFAFIRCHAVVVVLHRLKAVSLVARDGAVHVVLGVLPRIGVYPWRELLVRQGLIVARCENQPVVADCPGRLGFVFAADRVEPQVFHPDAVLVGFGDCLAQLEVVPGEVLSGHILDIGPAQVFANGMHEVDVVLVHQEQVEVAVQAVQAVVVVDGGFQPLAVVEHHRLIHVVLGRVADVLLQIGMAGDEDVAVVSLAKAPLGLILSGQRVGCLVFMPALSRLCRRNPGFHKRGGRTVVREGGADPGRT